MSGRFPTPHPFYDAMNRGMAEERMKRILALVPKYECCPKLVAYADAIEPIVDRDPGDEG